MSPVNHGVTGVQGVDALGKDLDAKRVDGTRRLERLVPPAGGLEKARADVSWYGRS
jgi:hypothetical protein